jgi:hypothetical protein
MWKPLGPSTSVKINWFQFTSLNPACNSIMHGDTTIKIISAFIRGNSEHACIRNFHERRTISQPLQRLKQPESPWQSIRQLCGTCCRTVFAAGSLT